MNNKATIGPHWVSRSAFQIVVMIFALVETALAILLHSGASLWFVLPLVLLAGHLMHGAAVGFHEASHGLLRRNRILNEFDGVLIGVFSFMSFSLYRVVHQWHHAHLTTERDEEFWPFVDPGKPLWARRLAAFLELSFGMIYTPLLFLRIFLRQGAPIRSRKVRRRIWSELLLAVLVWSAVIAAISYWQVWRYFVWMYLAPAFVAGNLQSWRKYVEHMGLTGGTVNSTTRSIMAQGWSGKLMAWSLLHEPFHGVHHQNVGIPHPELPFRAEMLLPMTAEELPPFPSYFHAVMDMLRSLANPRIGSQWHNEMKAS
jgi:fatty acid desaturase